MKNILLLMGCIGVAICNSACSDDCETTRTYRTTVPVVLSFEQIRSGIASETPQDLKNPGKIYIKIDRQIDSF